MKKSLIVAFLLAVVGLSNIVYIFSFGGNIYTLIISISLFIFSIANLFGTISSVKKRNRQTELSQTMYTPNDSRDYLNYVYNTVDDDTTTTTTNTSSTIKIVNKVEDTDRKNNKHSNDHMTIEVKSKEEFF